MTLYSGQDINLGPVTLSLPDPREIENSVSMPDMVEAMTQWLQRAMSGSDTLYFAIRLDGMLAGQIFLYDLDAHADEAQVGLHLFDPAMRGRGVGPAALALLQQYVAEQTSLKRLVFMVANNHSAALRAAEKCGFRSKGKSKKDSQQVVYVWNVPTD
ncbi:acetyltransferase [Longilinea arvoryzae]|uniref:Acetyltransferase n=1 Tax=Longilinea arvoryzae TaxID=360412 RepID=A0A0S7B5L1_9CHLR|nr:GNAT family protein [Longilinea arvoryzae]GAP12476.1 acetyltransferase [Longilinea arvoryzae]